jgi:two-component system chemotaxis response regulator CheY
VKSVNNRIDIGIAARSRVLLVEPDDDTRLLYRQSLELIGCDVVEASDGRDALAKAFGQQLALIVTETRLAWIDGFALCEVLRRDAITRNIPILVLTGESPHGQIERARAAGATSVLVKPASLEGVIREMRRLISAYSRHQPGAATIAGAAGENAQDLLPSQRVRTSYIRAHQRCQTTAPPRVPPQIVCPACDVPLKYQHSHIGGVTSQNSEQWDYFICPSSCGTFQYRQRTRKLRRIL